MENKNVVLSVELVNAVLGYLASKPYQETFQLIQQIQAQAIPQLPPADEQKPAE